MTYNMRILVTGGAGFIGSHLTDRLLSRGDAVTALDDLSTGSEDNIAHLEGHPRFTFVKGSILDPAAVDGLVGETDAVVHLAAAVGVKLIIDKPLESLLTNIRGTEIVLDAAAAYGRKTLIASTSEIYGKNGTGPMHEDSDRVLGPVFKSRWSYSTAKAVDEILARAYWKDRGVPTIVARLFNCSGPRQTGEFGMVLPTLAGQALAGDDLTVFGDGEQTRCFCHVLDTVEALVALLDHPSAVGDVFNVGNPDEVSMNELARIVIEAAGSRSSVVHVPYDEAYEEGFEDMKRRVPDISRIRNLTGWEPSRGLEQIVADVIAHQRVGEAEQAGA
ncbi:MAG TPA: GDP-mannose 4,6-dehydratase [Actinomycetota bacterium]|nr:GDP-mannose 4,6-dehydratase [Actinomycetota bacterium]